MARLGRWAGSRAEGGSTLIELLVAIVIMGIAFVVIVGGIGTAIIGADSQKQQAGADVVARSAAEAITAQDYRPCTATDPPDYPFTPPSGSGIDVTTTPVSYWNPGTNQFQPTCPDPDGMGPLPVADTGLQLITVKATSSSGTKRPSEETVKLVKRRP
ncbi:MAG TPA: type II secretion system protein [Acidimicrobiales bacterium]|nr:type II secretion system protein [Acidimicrobiales bacterium]